MSMMDLTADSLGKMVESEVPELYVVIAKNSVVGMGESDIAEMLGVTLDELRAETGTELYKNVRLLVASEYAKESIDADFGWDDLEGGALKKLAKRIAVTNDTDQLLRIAAVANRATRRVRPDRNNTLDPRLGGAKVQLQLSERIVRKLQNGIVVESQERTVKLTDGSATNPTFGEVDSLLGVRGLPKIPEKFVNQIHGADFSVDDLEFPG